MSGFRGSIADLRNKKMTQAKRQSGLNKGEITLLFIDDGMSTDEITSHAAGTSQVPKIKLGLRKLEKKGLLKSTAGSRWKVTPKGKALRKTLV